MKTDTMKRANTASKTKSARLCQESTRKPFTQ